jgi:phosphoglycolate phosphatase
VKPAAYLFDLDGTLVDTAPDLMRALNQVLDAAGLPLVDEATTRHWVGHGVRAMLAAALEHHETAVSEDRLDQLFAACLEHYGAHIADHSAPYPTVVETLTALAARVPLAVVTNKPAHLTELLLRALDLRHFFGSVVGRGTTREHKPAAAPALYACRELGVSPPQALFVGDSATDVACARAAGCRVVLYRYGYHHGEDPDALGADAVIDSLAALR